MRVPQININDLSLINPEDVKLHLQKTGWKESQKTGDRESGWRAESTASIWRIQRESKQVEVLLPLDPDIPDFGDRIYEIFEVLEIIEQRPKVEILDDLKSVYQISKEKGREILKLALLFPSNYGFEAPITHLSAILSSFQGVVSGIGQSLAIQEGIINFLEEVGIEEAVLDAALEDVAVDNVEDVAVENVKRTQSEFPFRISPDIAEEMELCAFGSFKGSFGVKLISAPKNLLGDKLVTDTLKEVIELLQVQNETDFLTERLIRLRTSSARRYVEFLKSLKNARAGLRLDWGSPKPGYGGTAELLIEEVEATLETIKDLKQENKIRFSMKGKLVEGNVTTQHFIFSDNGGRTFKGYIDREAMPRSKVLPLNKECNVLMEETTKLFLVTNKNEVMYRIVELHFVGEEELRQFNII